MGLACARISDNPDALVMAWAVIPMPKTIQIIVDDREQASGIPALLRAHGDVELRVDRLPLGDYLIDNALLFERKALADLAESIKDGRLFRQGLRLTAAPYRVALLLEGRASDLNRSGMSRESIQGALVTLTLFFGLPLLRAMTADESVRLMLYAARQGRAITTGRIARPGLRPRGKARVQRQLLQGVPGIGPERAARLIERFGSVQAILTADEQALAEVPGIGRTTAAAIRWAVEEQTADYSAGIWLAMLDESLPT
jgi:ERCC4-type nuclease